MADKKQEIVQQPNIAYVGPKGEERTLIHSGMREPISLPKDQSKPFYHERAGEIISQYRGLYKKVVPQKGAK